MVVGINAYTNKIQFHPCISSMQTSFKDEMEKMQKACPPTQNIIILLAGAKADKAE
jgi:hypothetical protein